MKRKTTMNSAHARKCFIVWFEYGTDHLHQVSNTLTNPLWTIFTSCYCVELSKLTTTGWGWVGFEPLEEVHAWEEVPCYVGAIVAGPGARGLHDKVFEILSNSLLNFLGM